MLSLRPFTARVRGKLLGARPLEELADKTAEIAPGITLPRTAAITLPGEWDRIEKFHPDAVVDWELKHATEGDDFHPATLSYLFRGALVADGTVYVRGGYRPIVGRRPRPVLTGRPVRLEEAQLCSDAVVEQFFGHWLTDGLSLELLAAERGLAALAFPGPPYGHEPSYRARAELETVAPQIATVEQLWTVDDRPMNLGRIARLRELRRRIRAPEAEGPRRVYLDRGRSGVRRDLDNRDEIVEALRSQGFVEVFPEEEDADGLAAKLSNVEICVGVEGSALTHAVMLLPAGAALLELQPANRFTMIMKAYTDFVGIHLGFVVGESAGDSFNVPVARLLRTLELVEAKRAGSPAPLESITVG